jgi:hypothetical protein
MGRVDGHIDERMRRCAWPPDNHIENSLPEADGAVIADLTLVQSWDTPLLVSESTGTAQCRG